MLRPRTVVYATLLALLATGFGYSITHRNLVGVDVLRDRNALYRERPDETVENVYNVKILNKDAKAHEFTITASGLPGIVAITEAATVWVGPGQVQGVPVRIRIPEDALEGGADIEVSIQATDAPELRATGKARFLAPTD